MEISEGKTKEIHATTTNSSSSQCFYASLIPFDLTREILIRLPAKSLLRFRCVSREWAYVTSDQEFINSFTTYSSSMQRSCLLLNFQEKEKKLYFFIPQRKDLEMCSSPMERYHLTLQRDERYMFPRPHYQSVHGFVSFEHTYDIVIWNPTVRECITFRKPYDDSMQTKSYLGYDPIGNTYKLLSLLYGSTDEPHVLTLGATKSSWRKIKSIPTHFLPHQGICIDGVLFYMFYVKYVQGRREVMSFNVRTEKFNLIQTHSCMQHIDSMIGDNPLLNYKGKLAWVLVESSVYKLWVLEDADNAKWSCKDFHLPVYPEVPSSGLHYVLYGVTNDGEFIYLSMLRCEKAVYVYYYDPKRNNNNMRIKVEISEDDDLWVHTHAARYWDFSWIFSNHIENLMSVNQLTCSPSEPLFKCLN